MQQAYKTNTALKNNYIKLKGSIATDMENINLQPHI